MYYSPGNPNINEKVSVGHKMFAHLAPPVLQKLHPGYLDIGTGVALWHHVTITPEQSNKMREEQKNIVWKNAYLCLLGITDKT